MFYERGTLCTRAGPPRDAARALRRSPSSTEILTHNQDVPGLKPGRDSRLLSTRTNERTKSHLLEELFGRGREPLLFGRALLGRLFMLLVIRV